MATSPRRSLVSRAGAAARKVVRRAGEEAETPSRTAAKQAGAKKAATKKAATKKTAATKAPAKAPAKKAPANKAPAKKAPAKKAPAKKAPATKAVPTKAPAKKAPATKAAPTKAPAKKAPATKAVPTKAPAKKAPATKAAPASAAPAKKSASTKKEPATKAAGPKTPSAAKAPARKSARRAGSLVVLEQEQPWTSAELREVTTQLNADVDRLTVELAVAEEDLAGLMREGSDGAGNDQADVGTATFERDQEMTVVHNAREMLLQSQHALERIADGSYGVCEHCGNPIGKNRLMAFPRATLCLSCKQREERR